MQMKFLIMELVGKVFHLEGLNQNHLTTLPPALGSLTSLRQFHLANNNLASLPPELEFLNQLQILNVRNNSVGKGVQMMRSPKCVSSLLSVKIKGVAAGLCHTIYISADGAVYTFGGNQFGQLGTEDGEVFT